LIDPLPGYGQFVGRFGKLTVILAAVGLLWLGLAYDLTRPPDERGYRRTLVQVAESAHDAARTGWLTGREQLAGHVFGPFATTAFDDAQQAAAGASKQFSEQAPAGTTGRRLRDELRPLVQDTVRLLGDAAAASDDAALRAAVDGLAAVADRLDRYLEANR
jgi:hypothetical protein